MVSPNDDQMNDCADSVMMVKILVRCTTCDTMVVVELIVILIVIVWYGCDEWLTMIDDVRSTNPRG